MVNIKTQIPSHRRKEPLNRIQYYLRSSSSLIRKEARPIGCLCCSPSPRPSSLATSFWLLWALGLIWTSTSPSATRRLAASRSFASSLHEGTKPLSASPVKEEIVNKIAVQKGKFGHRHAKMLYLGSLCGRQKMKQCFHLLQFPQWSTQQLLQSHKIIRFRFPSSLRDGISRNGSRNQCISLHEYMRAGNMFSFRSWAVSTKIRKGPLGVNTATRSVKVKVE